MPKPNDCSRSVTAFEQNSTLIAVIGAPQLDHLAIEFQIDFVQMPCRVGWIFRAPN